MAPDLADPGWVSSVSAVSRQVGGRTSVGQSGLAPDCSVWVFVSRPGSQPRCHSRGRGLRQSRVCKASWGLDSEPHIVSFISPSKANPKVGPTSRNGERWGEFRKIRIRREMENGTIFAVNLPQRHSATRYEFVSPFQNLSRNFSHTLMQGQTPLLSLWCGYGCMITLEMK